MIVLAMMEITKEKIREYAQKYDNNRENNDEMVENEMKEWLESKRYLDKEKFVKIGLWKSTRPKKKYESNDDLTVREITRFSFSTNSEEAKIKSLMVLNGVGYPVASAILHFAFPNKYPILDFRAIWSLGWEQPKNYTFDFWQKYCGRIRDISKETGESRRTVDKALWKYSEKHQPKNK